MTDHSDQQASGETARSETASGEKRYWLDEPRNVTKIVCHRIIQARSGPMVAGSRK